MPDIKHIVKKAGFFFINPHNFLSIHFGPVKTVPACCTSRGEGISAVVRLLTPSTTRERRSNVTGIDQNRASNRPSEHHYNRVSLRNDTCEESADKPYQLLRKSYCNRDQIGDFIAFFGRSPALQRTYLEL